MKIFNLPDLGEGLAEAEIRQWYVAEGDEVNVEQPLVAVETAKALVDVPSPEKARVVKLYGKPGDIIKTGQPLVAFESEHTESAAHDTGTVVGNLESSNQILEESATGIAPTTQTSAGVRATPAVRALAHKLQIDLTTLTGTGPQGSITIDDVLHSSTPASATSSTTTPLKPGMEALPGIKRVMATHMSHSHKEIVPITLMDDADIQQWQSDEDFTLRIIRAIIAGCLAEPAINAHFDGKNLARQLFKEINLGVAVDTMQGLYVPVLKNVAEQNVKTLREEINQFKQLAKEQAFPLETLQGATITLSNFGTLAGRYATPIILPPTVAILGVGKSCEEVVAVSGKAEIHKILPLSLSVDHRAVTGGEAARFLAAVIKDLQS